GPQPGGGLVQAGDLATLDAVEEGEPAVDLAVVEPVGTTEALELRAAPVDLRQLGDALDQRVGEAAAGAEVGLERLGPGLAAGAVEAAHGGPAVDEAHQVEGAPEHR